MRRATETALIGLVLILVSGCSTVQGDGQLLIEQGRYQEGLAQLEAAMRERPTDAQRRVQYFLAYEKVLNRLLGQAGAEFGAGRFDAADALYNQALAVEPNNGRATAGLAAIEAARRHQVLATDSRARLAAGDNDGAGLMAKAILAENPNHIQARQIERELHERERKNAIGLPALKSKLQNPVTLEFREAPLKQVLEALSRSAGINFVLDRDVRADLRVSIFVRGVRVEDALDLVIQNNQLERKILSDNTLLIYPNTPQKLREHQELVMRTFHLGNADPKQTLNMLRTMLKTKDIFVDERVNMIVMRDTPDVIRAAERLIEAQDRPDPEVVLELEILEVARNKVRDLGITYPTTFVGPTGTVADIRVLNSTTITTDTGFALRLLRTDAETKTLANPRVRVRNREKARVHVGDRVPVISSTVVGTSAAGTQAVTTEQIQYIDVGIKIEAEPNIHADESVDIKINLDVSTLGTQTKTNAGSIAYEVGTRNTQTVLRLRNGETQALMGLIRDDEGHTASGLPYIGEAPVLDRLFGTKRTETRSRELILLVTPVLVRMLERPDASLGEFWSGTEAMVRTRSPLVQQVAEKDARAAAATGAAATLAIGGAPAAAAAATTAAAVAVSPLLLSWQAPAGIKVGEEFRFELNARSEGLVKGASVQVRFDPELIEMIAVEDGGFFREVGGAAVFTPRIDAALGVVFATIGASGAGSAKGDGPLIKLRAKLRKPVPSATFQIGSIIGVDPTNRRVPIEGQAPLELKSLP
jgi:general secretion pathway protein D